MRADEPHPEVQSVLELIESMGAVPLSQFDPATARSLFEEFRTGAGPEMAAVEDRTIPGPGGDLPVRVYRPTDDEELPTTVYFHGGGFVIGSPDTHESTCRHLADAAETVVVAVDYRLAPEHPFPAAVEDAIAATEWVADNPDAVGGDGQVAVAGDSAGGTLAAVSALAARDRGGPDLTHQVLVYPATSPADDWDSIAENAEGYFLVAEDLEWFRDQYLDSPVHEHNPYAFPMAACDLTGLPPATVVTAGFDPLRDQGVAYADRLDAAGMDVTHRNYEAMIHGFAGMLEAPSVERAHEAMDAIAADLSESFGR